MKFRKKHTLKKICVEIIIRKQYEHVCAHRLQITTQLCPPKKNV